MSLTPRTLPEKTIDTTNLDKELDTDSADRLSRKLLLTALQSKTSISQEFRSIGGYLVIRRKAGTLLQREQELMA